ncbi:MAG: GNAT family N-acetyltransferase [Ruminococcaceae bacterium]|nr:GNAT family N-acetyltransferase [Oscillospiraceae bacterium]
MIKITDNINDVIPLWKEAFGDSDEDIIFFVDNAENCECLAYYQNDKLSSMMFLVDCFVDGIKGKYVYAACTAKEFRGCGYMGELIEYAHNLNYSYICLIPANDALVDFYFKRGFTKSVPIDNLSFNQSDEINEYLFEGYNLSKPCVMIYEGE